MARRQARVTITAEGRDKGKIFVIDEMSASEAEDWATQALLAISRSGISMPDEALGAGMAGVAIAGVKSLSNLQWDEVKPLMDEMWRCIRIQPDPKKPELIRELIEEDIEEVATRLKLRAEVLELHTGFSLTGLVASLKSPNQSGGSETIPTSPAPSAPSSPPIAQPSTN